MRDDLKQVVAGDWNLVARLDVVSMNEFRRQVEIETVANFYHPAVLSDRLPHNFSFLHSSVSSFSIDGV